MKTKFLTAAITALTLIGASASVGAAAAPPKPGGGTSTTWTGNGMTANGEGGYSLNSSRCDAGGTPYVLFVLGSSKATSATLTIGGSAPVPMIKSNGTARGESSFKYTYSPGSNINLGALLASGVTATYNLTTKVTLTASHGCVGSFTVTATATAGGTSVASPASVPFGGSSTLTATPGDGYTFTSWSCTVGTLSSTTSNPATLSSITADSTCTPTFTAIPNYTVTFTTATGGSASASPSTVRSGGSSTLTATADSGYTFTDWSCTVGTLSSTTDNPTTLSTITADSTCTPTFTAIPNYSVTVATVTGGSGSASPSTVLSGGSSTLTATADSGYTFTSWSCTVGTLSSTTDNPTTLSAITADSTCTPTFTADSGSGGGPMTVTFVGEYRSGTWPTVFGVMGSDAPPYVSTRLSVKVCENGSTTLCADFPTDTALNTDGTITLSSDAKKLDFITTGGGFCTVVKTYTQSITSDNYYYNTYPPSNTLTYYSGAGTKTTATTYSAGDHVYFVTNCDIS